jgi:hypothetical protein
MPLEIVLSAIATAYLAVWALAGQIVVRGKP